MKKCKKCHGVLYERKAIWKEDDGTTKEQIELICTSCCYAKAESKMIKGIDYEEIEDIPIVDCAKCKEIHYGNCIKLDNKDLCPIPEMQNLISENAYLKILKQNCDKLSIEDLSKVISDLYKEKDALQEKLLILTQMLDIKIKTKIKNKENENNC
jgi:flagellar biosynthesis component FlhA